MDLDIHNFIELPNKNIESKNKDDKSSQINEVGIENLLENIEHNKGGLEISSLDLPEDINDISQEYYEDEDEDTINGKYVFNKPESKDDIESDKTLDKSIPLTFNFELNDNIKMDNGKELKKNIPLNFNFDLKDEPKSKNKDIEKIINLENELTQKVTDPNIKMIKLNLNNEEEYSFLNKEYKNKKST